jgi:hypothetical protein
MPNNTAQDDFEDFDGDSDGSLYTAFDARNGVAPNLDREQEAADLTEKLRNVSPESRRPDLNIDPAFLRAARFKDTRAASTDKLGLFVSIAIILGIMNLAATGWSISISNGLLKKDSPIAVQLTNGKSIQVQRIDPQQRSADSINKFVRAFLLQTFTCTNRKPIYNLDDVNKIEKDPGIPINIAGENSVTIPTIAWSASWSVSEVFREHFLVNLGKMIAPYNLMQAGQEGQSTIVIRNLSAPVSIKAADGKNYWEVTVNATIIITPKNQPQGVTIPYNKVLTVQAAEPIAIEELSQEVQSDDLVSIIYQARGSGLIISDFRDFGPTTGTAAQSSFVK